MEAINERLKEVRNRLGYTQKEFAGRLAVNTSYYSDLETGRRKVTGRLLEKMQSQFGLSSDWMYTGEGEMTLRKSNNSHPLSVLHDVPKKGGYGNNYIEKPENDKIIISPGSEDLVDKLLLNTKQQIRFYCNDFLGRLSISNDPRINIRAVKKRMKDLENFEYYSPEHYDFESFTIDEKIQLLYKLNQKVTEVLDFIWEAGIGMNNITVQTNND